MCIYSKYIYNTMGGGLLQLVAYGAQDVYLTGNPQITFFKVVYRRHTNFSIESIQQTFNGSFDFGKRVTCQISRNGDLLHKLILEVDLPALKAEADVTNILGADYDRYVNYVGLRLIQSAEIEIGGQKIDKQYSYWMYVWNELSLPQSKQLGYQTMVGADSDMTSFKDNKLFIPLEFWFCRNVGLALPLIALQYHEVKLNLDIETFENCTYHGTAYRYKNTDPNSNTYVSDNKITTPKSITRASLWADYIFLDTDERRRFAQMSHEYLIEQLQFTGPDSIKTANSEHHHTVSFNHPVKELIWTITDTGMPTFQWYNFTTPEGFVPKDSDLTGTAAEKKEFLMNNVYGIDPDGNNPVVSARLQLNGNDRFAPREGNYFSLIQPYQHHTNIPTNEGINVYSFALKPEEHQCSGTINLSRIDNCKMSITSSCSGTLRVWGVNYNVLRILSGMGGLAYSN